MIGTLFPVQSLQNVFYYLFCNSSLRYALLLKSQKKRARLASVQVRIPGVSDGKDQGRSIYVTSIHLGKESVWILVAGRQNLAQWYLCFRSQEGTYQADWDRSHQEFPGSCLHIRLSPDLDWGLQCLNKRGLSRVVKFWISYISISL